QRLRCAERPIRVPEQDEPVNAPCMTRAQTWLTPDRGRVVTRRFVPGGAVDASGATRTARILSRILLLSESEVVESLSRVHRRFADRHRDLRGVFEANFASVLDQVEGAGELSPERLSLIGAYFTHEYAIE